MIKFLNWCMAIIVGIGLICMAITLVAFVKRQTITQEYNYMLYIDHTHSGDDIVSDTFVSEHYVESQLVAEDVALYYDVYLVNLGEKYEKNT